MHADGQLFHDDVTDVHVTAQWNALTGWRVTVGHRHGMHDGWECPVQVYDRLTLAEAVDTIDSATRAARGF